MTPQENKLLLEYLCMALPHGLVIETPEGRDYLYKIYIYSQPEGIAYINKEGFPTEECKPYLRPMSSMTEEEKVQLSQYACIGEDMNGEFIDEVQRKDCAAYIDWLLKYHFDFMGLLPKGLAIEVTKENNPYKE